MHQETLAYMWHEAPYAWKQKPEHYGTVPPRMSQLPRRRACRFRRALRRWARPDDATPFAWDNERPSHRVAVAAFEIDVFDVTNGEFMEFVDAGGYRDPLVARRRLGVGSGAKAITHPHFWDARMARWFWRGMFERVPLPGSWPVYVTWAEAHAFARVARRASAHRGGVSSRRVRHGGRAERRYPWGDADAPRAPRQFRFRALGSGTGRAHRDGASAFGVHDLVGNGWEWTSDAFAPFDGFRADGVVSGVFGGILRRRAFRDEGRLAVDGARTRAARIPQLVPAALSVRLRHVPLRGSLA